MSDVWEYRLSGHGGEGPPDGPWCRVADGTVLITGWARIQFRRAPQDGAERGREPGTVTVSRTDLKLILFTVQPLTAGEEDALGRLLDAVEPT